MTRQPPQGAMPEEIGTSDAFLDFRERLSRVALVDRPVLLIGERGTGKELAARRIHYLSRRWDAPLMTLNGAALSQNLIESELFGYESGAFTDARKRRVGRFEAADGGSLFLDEIGLIPMVAQEKILRVVEYGMFERVGGTDAVSVDVRIIGATNADLPALAAAGTFKHDLLDRLSFEVLHVPPLREREGDILLLAEHIISRMSVELGFSEPPLLSREAERQLRAHPWPGNVRELKNVVERAVYRAEGRDIEELVFDPFARNGEGGMALPPPAAQLLPGALAVEGDAPASAPEAATSAVTWEETIHQTEVSLLRGALEAARHNQRAAAARLGMSYHQFRGKYKKYRAELEGGE